MITAHCKINNKEIALNQNVVYRTSTPDLPLNKFLREASKGLNISYPKLRKMDSMCQAAVIAVECIARDQAFGERYDRSSTGILLCNQSASLYTDINYQKSLSSFPSPGLFVYTLPNIAVGEIAIRNGIQGENAFFVQDQFDASFFSNYTQLLMENEGVDCCLVGWLEANPDDCNVILSLVEKPKEENTKAAAYAALQQNFEQIFN